VVSQDAMQPSYWGAIGILYYFNSQYHEGKLCPCLPAWAEIEAKADARQ
jgi:hypothetical protein